MKKKVWIPVVALTIILIGVFFVFRGSATEDEAAILTTAQRGDFQVEITTTGELEAKNSVRILGPSGLRNARIYQVKIERLINEGTVVKKGDYVATLDKSELASRIKDVELDLETRESQYTQTRLDTALTLRQARDELVNLKFALTEKQIVLEQSKYEPPATIKQAQIDLEKAQRALKQAQENYKIKRNQAIARMQQSATQLTKAQRELGELTTLIAEFTIVAPEDGMVIYERERNGTRIMTGSTIGAFNPVVATLPDLSTMVSRTYVNEVDIRKVKTDQTVQIGLDAYPDKKLTGKVVKVANVGEQKPNSDAKVFEVSVQINEPDTALRPAMTTSNTIIADIVRDVVYVPLECLHNQGDSLLFVYKRSGMNTVLQEVEVGKSNTNEVVVVRGIDAGEKLYLSVPNVPEGEKKQIVLLDWEDGRKNPGTTPSGDQPEVARDQAAAPGVAAREN